MAAVNDNKLSDAELWETKWTSARYIAKRRENFETVDAYLGHSGPQKLLDIGCGFAWESRWFNEKYGTELWLLDGDSDANYQKPVTASYGNWNTNSSGLLFYHSLAFLDTKLQDLGTKNYHLVDANAIDIHRDVKFDLITSWLSCGHHYPVKTYADLMKRHSHPGTRIILDVRCKGTETNFIGVDGFEIVNIVSNTGGKKRTTVEIRLL